jgi:hypothetical protein
MATLIVCNWHTECSCGYNRGSYMDPKPAGHVSLTPDSTECPGCGEEFTDVERMNTS